MEFKKALNKLINQYGISILNEIFISRSILFDYVKSDFENKRLVELFIVLLDKEKAYLYCKKNSLIKSQKYLVNRENKYLNNYSSKEYITICQILIELTHDFKNKSKVKISDNKWIEQIEKIELYIASSSCEIWQGNTDEIEVLVNNKKINLKSEEYYKKGSKINIKLQYFNKEIKLFFPSKKYKLLDIETKNTNIKVMDDQNNNFGFEEVKINNINGDIKLFSDSSRVSLNTINGDIVYQGKVCNLSQISTNGDIKTAIKVFNENVEVFSKTINGDINTGFIGLSNEKLIDIPNYLMNLNHTIQNDDNYIHLNLNTKNGYICV